MWSGLKVVGQGAGRGARLEAAGVALAVGVDGARLGLVAHVARGAARPVGVPAPAARPVALGEDAWHHPAMSAPR